MWVANVGDKSVTQIDAATRKIVRTIKLTGAPTGLSAGDGGLWVTDGRAGTVQRIDMDTGAIDQAISVRPKLSKTQFFTNVTSHLTGAAWMPVLVAHKSVWVGDAFSSRIFRLDPRRGRVPGRSTATRRLRLRRRRWASGSSTPRRESSPSSRPRAAAPADGAA